MTTKNTKNTVTIDGVEYAPVNRPSGTRAIVVVDRGWVFAGDVTRENGRILLSRAVQCFTWSGGFTMLVADPKKAKADLRPVSDVDIPAGAEVFCVPVSENWGL